LVDLELVISLHGEDGEDRRFKLFGPEISFAVYAGDYFLKYISFVSVLIYFNASANEQEREKWMSAIRNAKASLLVSLDTMHSKLNTDIFILNKASSPISSGPPSFPRRGTPKT
jgi:hypothetical protein